MVLAVVALAGPWVVGIAALVGLSRARRRIDELEARVLRLSGVVVSPPEPAAPPPAEALPAPPPPPGPRFEPLPTTLWGPAARPPVAEASSLEEKIALVWFTRVGAAVLLLGAAYFFKYAVDNEWIGPTGRVALGALAGAGAIALAEALGDRAKAAWRNGVQGAGVALLFVSLFAAAALYRLLSFGAAFAGVAAVAVAGGALALRHRSQLLLLLALAGGLAAPVLLSTGEDRPVALLAWLLALAALTLAVSARERFLAAPAAAFAGTAALFAAWHAAVFETTPPPASPDPHVPLASQMGAYHLVGPRLLPLLLVLLHLALWLGAWERFRAWLPRAVSDAWVALALAAGQLATFALLHDRPVGAGLSVAGSGLLVALFAARAEGPVLLPAGAALGGLLLAVAGAHGGWWIAAAALWGAVYLVAAARGLLTRGDAVEPAAVAAAAIAGLGFAGLGIHFTGPKEGLLRAVLAGGAGAAELALGAAALPRGRARATALLGAALGLLAAAIAFLFSGATVTVAWAAIAAAVAVMAAREREPLWLGGAALLFAAALVRLVGVDLPARPLAAPFLRSGSGLALAGTGAALLVAARAVARPGEGWARAAAALATAGHLCLLALCVAEVRGLLLDLPAPPPASDPAMAREHAHRVAVALAAQRGKLDTTVTVVLALYASLLLAAGFAARERFHRWLGIALFAAALGKVVVSDVWRLPRLHQILVLLAVGALLLAAAFLYARFGKRILGLLALLALLRPFAAAGAPLDVEPFATVRPLEGIEAGGFHAFRVDAELWRASRAATGTLGDLRVVGPDGAEVAWALRAVGPGELEEAVPGTLLDPVVLPDGAVRATLDKGRAGLRSDLLRLDLRGDDFVRAARVEASDDGRRWGLLGEGARVYAVKGSPEARGDAVRHPASEARYLRISLLPGSGPPPRIQGLRAVRQAARVPARDGIDLPAPARVSWPELKASLYDLDLASAGIPGDGIVLDLGGGPFERAVRVLGSTDGKAYASLATGLVWRGRDGEGLRVAVATDGRRYLRLEIRDGDAPALELRGARVEWRAQEIVVAAAGPGRHQLLVGAPGMRHPDYDLGPMLHREPGTPVSEARPGPSTPNPRHALRQELRPFSERHRLPLAMGLGLLLATLALWAVRLLRAAPPGR